MAKLKYSAKGRVRTSPGSRVGAKEQVNELLPDRYALDSDPVLGEGGMGRVLRARDVILDVPVALKVVRPDLAADRRFRKLFELEVKVSARFTHPHIVPLHDHGEFKDGTPFLGLAFADAGSFASLGEETPTWEEVLRLTTELLDALAHLHARGVLHRDLKPENVLLHRGEDGLRHVWLADLGLANASSSLARKKGRMEGTPGYMAPEQKMGLPREYGPWTDLYSIGVILWELVCGEKPFQNGLTGAEADLGDLVPRKGMKVPDHLELVLANLLDGEPLSRYDLAADLITELNALGPATIEGVTKPIVRTGSARTVAPAAPEVTGTSGAEDKWQEGSTMFHLCASDLRRSESATGRREGPDARVPAWNRPLPPAMPDVPPVEPGFGASARASLQLFALREPPLVAREDLLGKLWSVVRDVTDQRRSQVVLLSGEPGSGKSRLVDSLTRRLEEGGWAEALTLHYQNPPSAEDGYAGAARAIVKPWNESRASLEARLRRRLARERGSFDGAIKSEATLLARWAGLSTDDEEPVPDGIGLREVYRTLEARTWRGSSVLILEDVHDSAVDGDGLSIAETVLQSAADEEERQIVVIATLRSDALNQNPELSSRIQALRDQGAHWVEVPRLDRGGTLAMLQEMLTLTPELANKVVSKCEGNPLFARQLLVEWAGRGWLVDGGALQYTLAPGVDADAVMPQDAQVLFTARIEALAQQSGAARRFRDSVHLAAMAGFAIPEPLLIALIGDEMIDFARSCGVWEIRDGVARFDSQMMRQAVLSAVAERPDESYMHRRLGRMWAKLGNEEHALEVGRHALKGRDWAYAMRHLLAAAERAWRRGRTGDLEEASRLALEVVVEAEEVSDQAGWAQLWAARAAQVRGESSQAATRFKQAHGSFEAVGDRLGCVASLVGMGWAARQQGDLEDADRLYSEAITLARARGLAPAEAQAIAGKAWVEQQKRNFEGADILFNRVANRYQRLGDQRGVAEAVLGQAFVARRTGDFGDADELYQEAVEAFQEGDDLLGIARAKNGQAMVARQTGDRKRAAELFREAINIAEELGATDVQQEARFGQAELARVRGELDRADRIYQDHLRWAEREHAFENAIFANLGLAMVALRRDDLGTMYVYVTQAATVLERVPGHWLWAPYRLIVATMLARRGDRDQTYSWLWSASELGLGDTVDEDIASLLQEVCQLCIARRWPQVLRVAYKLAVEQLQRLGDTASAERLTRDVQQALR